MYTLLYARHKTFIRACMLGFAVSFCCIACFFMVGCSTKFNYNTFNTQHYSANYPTSQPPQVQQYNITKQNISNPSTLPNYITIQDTVIYVSCPQLTNFVISALNGYTLCFTTDAIVTIAETFRNAETAGIVSTADNLTLILQSNIYSGNSLFSYTDTQEEQTFVGGVKANNLYLYATEGSIYSGLGVCLQADNLNLASGKLILQSDQTAIQCQNLNIYGGDITLNASTAISCQNCTFYGGQTTINTKKCTINCNFLRIFNGILNITSKDQAIICKTLEKTDGFINITANSGIFASGVSISGGLLYVNCQQTGLQVTDYLNITDGTNVLASSGQGVSAIEADGLAFCATGGITVQNSNYVTRPTSGRYYGFSITSGQILYLQCNNASYAYVGQYTGSVCICTNVGANNYSTNGRLTGFKDCFFGLLFQPNINAYSLHALPSNSSLNFGAKWCNLGTVASGNGQLF